MFMESSGGAGYLEVLEALPQLTVGRGGAGTTVMGIGDLGGKGWWD